MNAWDDLLTASTSAAKKPIDRRDFLKVISMAAASVGLSSSVAVQIAQAIEYRAQMLLGNRLIGQKLSSVLGLLLHQGAYLVPVASDGLAGGVELVSEARWVA